MSQSNDMPRLPLTWTRLKHLSVTVPSLERGMSSAARLPALAVRTRPPNNVPGPTTHTFRAEGQLDTGAVASAVPIWLPRGLALRSRPRGGCHTAHPGRFGRTAQGLAWRYCAAGRGLTPARPTSLSPTLMVAGSCRPPADPARTGRLFRQGPHAHRPLEVGVSARASHGLAAGTGRGGRAAAAAPLPLRPRQMTAPVGRSSRMAPTGAGHLVMRGGHVGGCRRLATCARTSRQPAHCRAVSEESDAVPWRI